MNKIAMITALMLFSISLCRAQDKIVKRDGEIIDCKIVEILSESVKYKVAEYGEVLLEIPISKVEKLVFSTGKEMVIDHAARASESAEINSEDLFLVQRKSDLKIEFVSPIYGTTSISYEKAIRPGRSWEITAGIIGVGLRNPDKAGGFACKFGLKFMRSPDFYLQSMRYAHILKGAYMRPEIAFATYSGEDDWEQKYNRIKFALLVNFGKQIVYSDRIVIDYYGGIGYGYTNDTFTGAFPYVFLVVSNKIPLSLAWGLRVGFMLPSKNVTD